MVIMAQRRCKMAKRAVFWRVWHQCLHIAGRWMTRTEENTSQYQNCLYFRIETNEAPDLTMFRLTTFMNHVVFLMTHRKSRFAIVSVSIYLNGCLSLERCAIFPTGNILMVFINYFYSLRGHGLWLLFISELIRRRRGVTVDDDLLSVYTELFCTD